jgi:hypothetical protein
MPMAGERVKPFQVVALALAAGLGWLMAHNERRGDPLGLALVVFALAQAGGNTAARAAGQHAAGGGRASIFGLAAGRAGLLFEGGRRLASITHATLGRAGGAVAVGGQYDLRLPASPLRGIRRRPSRRCRCWCRCSALARRCAASPHLRKLTAAVLVLGGRRSTPGWPRIARRAAAAYGGLERLRETVEACRPGAARRACEAICDWHADEASIGEPG